MNAIIFRSKARAVKMVKTGELTDYGALVRAGDWAEALTAALRDNDVVHIPAGAYRLSCVAIPSGKTVCGEGESTNLIPLGERLFDIAGEAEAISPLAADMKDFSNEMTLKQPIGLEKGDLIYLFGQRNCQILADCGEEWALGRTYAKGFASFFAEFARVNRVSADGLSVTTEQNTVFPYYYADGTREHMPRRPKVTRDDYPQMRPCTTVQRVRPAQGVVLRDFQVSGCVSGTVIRGQWLSDCRMERVILRTACNRAPEAGFIFVHISESIDCVVKDCAFTVLQPPARRDDYVWADYWAYNTARILSSEHSGFEGCVSNFSTHAYEIGKADHRGACHACFVKNCRAENAVWSGVFVSGGSYDTALIGNTFTRSGQGIVTCGRKNTIIGNVIDLNIDPDTNYYYVRPLDGGTAGIALIEGYSIDSVVSDNRVSRAVTGLLIRDGYEDDNQFETGEIALLHNTVCDCACALMVYRNVANQGEKRFRLRVHDNVFAGGAPGTPFAGRQAYLVDCEMRSVDARRNEVSGFAALCERLPVQRRCDSPRKK